jgi:hypothetical protein
MNDRQRFNATMHYKPRDRSPIMDFNFWDETLPIWHEQGLPISVNRLNSDAFFGMDSGIEAGGRVVGVNSPIWLQPSRQGAGGPGRPCHRTAGRRRARPARKFMGSIPQPQSHLLSDRDSWETHFKPRLDPDNPARYPADWDERVKVWTDPDREVLAVLPGGSVFGGCATGWDWRTSPTSSTMTQSSSKRWSSP